MFVYMEESEWKGWKKITGIPDSCIMKYEGCGESNKHVCLKYGDKKEVVGDLTQNTDLWNASFRNTMFLMDVKIKCLTFM